LTAIGIVVGIIAAQLAGRLLEDVLFQTTASDAAAILAAAGALVFVAAIACAFPAWRAARVEPLEGLRQG
jgi:ABC-type antimicrobial peptide transport system permease subunit